MAIRNIITPADDRLRRAALKVTSFDKTFQQLVDDLLLTMHAAPGVGLAAPQVGESLRLFVAHLEHEPAADKDEDENGDAVADAAATTEHAGPSPAAAQPAAPGVGRVLVMVNPEITRFSEELEVGTEGCLSLPGFAGDVERPRTITIKYRDRHNQPHKLHTHGWMARVLQHEYDHLEGVLFIDRALDVWRIDTKDPNAA